MGKEPRHARLRRASAPRSLPLETAGPMSRARATVPVAKLGAGDAPAALAAPPVPSPPAVLTGPGHGRGRPPGRCLSDPVHPGTATGTGVPAAQVPPRRAGSEDTGLSRACPLAHWAKCRCSVGPQPTRCLESGPLSSSSTWQAEHGSRSQTLPLHTAQPASTELAADLSTPIPLYRHRGPAAPRASPGSVRPARACSRGWPAPARLPRPRAPARPFVSPRLCDYDCHLRLSHSLACSLSCLLQCDCRENKHLATYSEHVPRSQDSVERRLTRRGTPHMGVSGNRSLLQNFTSVPEP